LRKNVGELLFHELRMLAAGEMGIRDIFVRPYQGGNSLDQYYLLRDCKLVRKPAFLEMPSVTRSLLRRLMPQKYAQLCGSV
jgi:hypothetical protein